MAHLVQSGVVCHLISNLPCHWNFAIKTFSQFIECPSKASCERYFRAFCQLRTWIYDTKPCLGCFACCLLSRFEAKKKKVFNPSYKYLKCAENLQLKPLHELRKFSFDTFLWQIDLCSLDLAQQQTKNSISARTVSWDIHMYFSK